MDKTPCSQVKGPRFDPWGGNWIPHDATKMWHNQINTLKKKDVVKCGQNSHCLSHII